MVDSVFQVCGLREAMKKDEVTIRSRPSWTIEVHCRESIWELAQHAKERMLTEEIETAALSAFADAAGARVEVMFKRYNEERRV